MSEFRVEVVSINKVEPHPNADRLDLIKVWDYPVIAQRGQFKEGDKAVYISTDALVPIDEPRWAFLSGHSRIKAKKLRGIFSMGLLTEADPNWEVGKDVRDILKITKYEAPEPLQMGGDNEKCPFEFPAITDIEGLRKYPDILKGETVFITEKIHGCLTKDTPITMKNKKQKPISEIKSGDVVISYNINNKKFEERIVNRLIVRPPSSRIKWLVIELENGERLNITTNHQVKVKNGWKSAGVLRVGEDIFGIH